MYQTTSENAFSGLLDSPRNFEQSSAQPSTPSGSMRFYQDARKVRNPAHLLPTVNNARPMKATPTPAPPSQLNTIHIPRGEYPPSAVDTFRTSIPRGAHTPRPHSGPHNGPAELNYTRPIQNANWAPAPRRSVWAGQFFQTSSEAALTGCTHTPRNFEFTVAPPSTPSGSQRYYQDVSKGRNASSIGMLGPVARHQWHGHPMPSPPASRIQTPRAHTARSGLRPTPPSTGASSTALYNLRDSEMNPLARHLRDQLHDPSKRHQIRAAFKQADSGRTGKVTQQQLKAIINKHFQTRVSEKQIQRVMELFATNFAPGVIEYRDFLYWLDVGNAVVDRTVRGYWNVN